MPTVKYVNEQSTNLKSVQAFSNRGTNSSLGRRIYAFCRQPTCIARQHCYYGSHRSIFKNNTFWNVTCKNSACTVAKLFVIIISKLYSYLKSIISYRDAFLFSKTWQTLFKLNSTKLRNGHSLPPIKGWIDWSTQKSSLTVFTGLMR